MNEEFVITGEWRKLKNQAWGAVVPSGDEDLAGCEVVLTSKKTGAEARKTLKRRLAIFDDGKVLYSLEGEYAPANGNERPANGNGSQLPASLVDDRTSMPSKLRQDIIDALDSEDEDAVFKALMDVASHFKVR